MLFGPNQQAPAPQPQAPKGHPLTDLEKRLLTNYLQDQFISKVSGDEGKAMIAQMAEQFSQKITQHGEPPLEVGLRFAVNLEVAWGELLQALRPAHIAKVLGR